MFWLWIGLGVVAAVLLAIALLLLLIYFYLTIRYLDFVVRIFRERPLFIIPRGQPIAEAEDVRFPTSDGLTLCGCYLHAPVKRRQGVILFGLEFGSNRWACVPYCQFLVDNGFDVFAFESRGQGESNALPGYEPLQWVTDYEVRDVQAALSYLKVRPDADLKGIGFFGISKGGGAGLIAAAEDDYVRCFVTDGVFGTRTTMVPYMRKWVAIVSDLYFVQRMLPNWFYAVIADAGLRRVQKQSSYQLSHLERALPRLASRPLLMIHGGADTYIKPDMTRKLFGFIRGPKELWMVDGAKHNQALQVAGDQYRQRVLAFFQGHLGDGTSAPARLPPQLPTPGRGIRAVQPKDPAVLNMAEEHAPMSESR